MNCEHYSQLLPDFLQGRLEPGQRTEIEQHLAQCADCRADVELWQKLETLPTEQPSPRLRRNFLAMLARHEEQQMQKDPHANAPVGFFIPWLGSMSFRPSWAHAVAAVLLIASGFQMGRNYPSGSVDNNQIESLRQELVATRQMVTLSMLQQPSPGDRLQGINYSLQAGKPNPEVIGALIQTMSTDNNVDVRLAALDALRKYGDQSTVRKGMISSLQKQNSPLVQIALIDALVELKDKSAVKPLQELEQTRELNPFVKKRTEWGLAQLNKG